MDVNINPKSYKSFRRKYILALGQDFLDLQIKDIYKKAH